MAKYFIGELNHFTKVKCSFFYQGIESLRNNDSNGNNNTRNQWYDLLNGEK